MNEVGRSISLGTMAEIYVAQLQGQMNLANITQGVVKRTLCGKF